MIEYWGNRISSYLNFSNRTCLTEDHDKSWLKYLNIGLFLSDPNIFTIPSLLSFHSAYFTYSSFGRISCSTYFHLLQTYSIVFSKEVFFTKSDWLAWNKSFSKCTITSTRFLEAEVEPVTITSMSIIPVEGSVADCLRASLISSNAIMTWSSLTY